jgi:D-erythronate 2-dehydrogenase
MLPVLHASMAEVVDAIALKHGPKVRQRVRYVPDAKLQAQFANLPPMHCPRSVVAGFRHDGTIPLMIERALVEDV